MTEKQRKLVLDMIRMISDITISENVSDSTLVQNVKHVVNLLGIYKNDSYDDVVQAYLNKLRKLFIEYKQAKMDTKNHWTSLNGRIHSK